MAEVYTLKTLERRLSNIAAGAAMAWHNHQITQDMCDAVACAVQDHVTAYLMGLSGFVDLSPEFPEYAGGLVDARRLRLMPRVWPDDDGVIIAFVWYIDGELVADYVNRNPFTRDNDVKN